MAPATLEEPRVRRVLAIALGLAWALSLFLPAADAGEGYEDIEGAFVLMTGILGVGVGQFAWFANPLLFFVLTLCARAKLRPRLLRWSGGLLLLLTLSAAFWRDIPDDDGSNLIRHFGPGYWLWMATVATVGVWAVARPHLATAALSPAVERD